MLMRKDEILFLGGLSMQWSAKKNIIFRITGTILVITAFIFVGLRVYENRDAFTQWQPTFSNIIFFIVLVFLYSGSVILLALAWHKLTLLFGNDSISLKANLRLYMRTQIAKYIPGNIFSFASRHIASKALGFTHIGLVGAAISEIILVIFASVSIGLLGFLIWNPNYSIMLFISFVVAIIMVYVFLVIFKYLDGRVVLFKSISFKKKSYRDLFQSLLSVYLLYLMFFIISGLIFYSIILFLGVDDRAVLVPAITVYALSWVLGFITPGASGGMGVREAVMIGLLPNIVDEPVIILAALFFRLITIFGECMVFGFSFLIPVLEKNLIPYQIDR